MPDLQITLRSDQMARPLRQLTATRYRAAECSGISVNALVLLLTRCGLCIRCVCSISRLIKVCGIVISAAPVRARATAVRVQCTQCHKVKVRYRENRMAVHRT